jgi:molybdenum cofactor synthesis domain-containing protein
MKNNSPTASLIVIGNEILSGRTRDENINYIANELSDIGIVFSEVRIIKDIENDIVETVNKLRKKYDYVFTTGGIGPTHDDITSESLAKAFEVKMQINESYYKSLDKYYKGNLNEGRIKMVTLPEGAVPIDNEITIAPGYRIKNVFVMAGIPKIMQAMFQTIKSDLKKGQNIYKTEITVYKSESEIAHDLTILQNKYQDVEIGSYPFVEMKMRGAGIALTSSNKKSLDKCSDEVKVIFKDYLDKNTL